MPNCEVKLSALFLTDVRNCNSSRTAQLARTQLSQLATFPDMGRLATSPSLISRFGKGVRTLVCGSYLLVYRHTDNAVEALSLYPARLVR